MSIRIATVYTAKTLKGHGPVKMSELRWLRISEALARRGFEVDMIVNNRLPWSTNIPLLRSVSYGKVRWEDYDVVKTLFHEGFDCLSAAGGAGHSFIISKLGTVVGPNDATPGVQFYGQEREALFETQHRISRCSRYVTLLTEANASLWRSTHGGQSRILMVPTAIDERLPPAQDNPYAQYSEGIAVYIGNLYWNSQRSVNQRWQEQLNRLGYYLRRRGIRLCVIGPGRTDCLDADCVTYLGAVEADEIWDYHYFAQVGIVLARGPEQHNESSKIYYYLAAGLPVVSEAPIPNNHLIEETGLGFICPYDDPRAMAELIARAAVQRWDPAAAQRFMINHHTWKRRAAVYADVIDPRPTSDRVLSPS